MIKILNISTPINDSVYKDIIDIYQQYGVLLLQGLQLNPIQFESLTKLLCNTFYSVSSRSISKEFQSDGFTTPAPQVNFYLFSHSEATYAPYPPIPDIGFLLCTEAPDMRGGETTLIDGTKMFNTLPKELRERFLKEKITYEFLWEPKRWGTQFRVSSEKELLTLLKTIKMIKYTLNDGYLHMFYTTSAVILLDNGSYAFSNAILGHLPSINHPHYTDKYVYVKESNHVYWETGEPLSNALINQLIDIQDQLKHKHKWQQNDILIFNNLQFMHGREMTEDLCTRTLFSRFGYLSRSRLSIKT